MKPEVRKYIMALEKGYKEIMDIPDLPVDDLRVVVEAVTNIAFHVTPIFISHLDDPKSSLNYYIDVLRENIEKNLNTIDEAKRRGHR